MDYYWRLLTPLLWCVLAVAVILACDKTPGTEAGPLGRGVYVPMVWKNARAVSGHHAHVVERGVACSSCHSITGDSMGNVTPDRCAACHAAEAMVSHAAGRTPQKQGPGATSDCTLCHAFTSPEVSADSVLATANGGVLPGFAPGDCGRCHLTDQGAVPAVVVHGKQVCTECHQPHRSPSPVSADCTGCHEKMHTGHAPEGTPAVKECTTCHQHQHAPASEARGACVGCHAAHEPKVPATALFEGGHAECIGCHRPHAFSEQSAAPCRSCHENVHVLGGARAPKHQVCTSCHSPHDVKGSAAGACAGCHKSVHPDHPKQGAAGACVGCHDAHSATAHAGAKARPCSDCHQAAAKETAFHGGVACARCHAPHQFVRVPNDRALCRDCHGKQLAAAATLAGHEACEGCHRGLPHRPAALKEECAACHGAIQAKARPGHAACQSCHEPHGGTLLAACGSCHGKQERSAPSGHKACANCHDQHSGSADRATCSTCHAAEAKSAHGRVQTGCTTCHRAHGPEGVAKPPPCASCHEAKSLAGLHAVGRHGECQSCHQGHDAARAVSPKECLSCHTDRKAHFPDAPFCGSCHLFTKTR